ncbi:unnamed protein product [Knipowitschia caucasica]
MSDPLTSLIPKVSERSRRPKTLLLPPALPCPPVIKKTPIQISSFDERGLVCAIGPNSERSFVPILEKKCGQEASRQKSHEEKASTMKRMMSKMHYPAKLKSSTSPTSEVNHSAAVCYLKPLLGSGTERLGNTHTEDTPLLQPVDLDSRTQPKHPLYTREEQATIPRSNAKKLHYDTLDQDTLLAFTHKNVNIRECQEETLESGNPRNTCQNSLLMQGRLGYVKTANREEITHDISPVSPNTIINPQQPYVPSDNSVSEGIMSYCAAGNVSQPVFEGLSSRLSPSLHRRCIQYLQNATVTKPNTKKGYAVQTSLSMLQPMNKPNLSLEHKKNQQRCYKTRTPLPRDRMQSTGYLTTQNCTFSPSSGPYQHQRGAAQTDTEHALHQSNTVSMDYRCQSGNTEGQAGESECAKTLNQLKTCLPQAQKSCTPDSDFVNLKKHRAERFSSNKDCIEVRKQSHFYYSSEMPSRNAASQDAKESQKKTSVCVTEEDPYVTMYCLGSVYEDMSDIVPPEVKPKPAIPAKPPNVGAASPSSPFSPPMPPSAPSTGASLPPPSAIPVLIGSHGPSHSSSHSVTHSGHSAGHGVTHPPAPSGGHTTHSSSGGSTLLGYIGIDTIIEQMRRKTMKTGFDFNIMVVGNSGLGKSTLLNTLFKSQVSRKSAGWSRDEKIPKTVEMKSVSHVIEEGGVKMKLTVVDTPGFGDQINNDNCWDPISKYINEQFEKFLKEEVNITRKKRIPDTRVHCCIYFISPTGHSLRQLDLEFMKRLSHSVNIIPVIAKADTMTIEERQEFKQRVRKELEMGGIEFYPQKEFDDDMEDKSDNDKIRETMPFAVVGSEKEYQVNSKRVLGRKTAWGIVEVENPNHCEFAQLRDFLIRSHLQDLKEVTHNIHYETYRAKRLNENGGLHPISDTQDSNL